LATQVIFEKSTQSHPIGENSPNLATLNPSRSRHGGHFSGFFQQQEPWDFFAPKNDVKANFSAANGSLEKNAEKVEGYYDAGLPDGLFSNPKSQFG
jgi:hypothetical protein